MAAPLEGVHSLLGLAENGMLGAEIVRIEQGLITAMADSLDRKSVV